MFAKQISVFLENRQGRLDELTTLLGDNGIDMIALSVADSADFGLVRAIVDDHQRALDTLRRNGYTAKLSNVLAVAVPDSPGGLARVLRTLREGEVSIEYLYSLVRRVNSHAIIVLRVDQPEKAVQLFDAKGMVLLGDDAFEKK